ncbi:hypothetical protein HPB48_021074 [Haemaphysalis longicornis]|uniref:Uncharacterized protein n=1 Tax=Haemaphysalis longicornis TaxID=44386 RepID=A0A9J6FV04_HAELO|nr:hypothetical protein HPB48_021074 [Haemaphysalis longicornis]
MVMLAVMAVSRKLPPYVIIKRKILPKDTFPPYVTARGQGKAWKSAYLIADWMTAMKWHRPGNESIAEAWTMIGADIVVKSFKKTGIVNALDTTEDHLGWDEDKASKTDEKS